MKTSNLLEAKNLYALALHLIVIVLGAQVYVLSSQNDQLKARNDLWSVGRLKVGDAFVVDSLDLVVGPPRKETSLTGRQLIFVFSTTCRHCRDNIEEWRQLTTRAVGHGVTVFAISMDSLTRTSRYVERYGPVNYGIYVPLDIHRFAKLNRVAGVPLTVVRSALGVVEYYWLGQLESKQTEEILSKISS